MAPLELLNACIRRTAILNRVHAAIALGVGIAVLAVLFVDSIALETWQSVLVGLFGAAMFGAAWALVSSARKATPATSSRVYKALSSDGSDISWAHARRGRSNGVDVYFLDGEIVSISANRAEQKTLLELVVARAPNVVVGFGPAQSKAHVERVQRHRASKK